MDLLYCNSKLAILPVKNGDKGDEDESAEAKAEAEAEANDNVSETSPRKLSHQNGMEQ